MPINPAIRALISSALAPSAKTEPSSALDETLWRMERLSAWGASPRETVAAARSLLDAELGRDPLDAQRSAPASAGKARGSANGSAKESLNAFNADAQSAEQSQSRGEMDFQHFIAAGVVDKALAAGRWGGVLSGAFDSIGPDAALSDLGAGQALSAWAKSEPASEPYAIGDVSAWIYSRRGEKTSFTQRASLFASGAKRVFFDKDNTMRMQSSATLRLSATAWGSPAPWGAGERQEVTAPWKSREQDGSWISTPKTGRTPSQQGPEQSSLNRDGYLSRLAAARGKSAASEAAPAPRRSRGLGGASA